MPPSLLSSFRPHLITVLGLLLLAVGMLLRVEAYDLCTVHIHVDGTPGTEPNNYVTHTEHFQALVEIARLLLGLSALLLTAATTAWLFVPAHHVPRLSDSMTIEPTVAPAGAFLSET